MMRQGLFILSFCILHCFVFAQNKTKIDSLKSLGRNALIELAVKKINDKNFNPKYYDRIIVKADSSNLWVEFSLSVKLNDGACYYDAISVSLIGSGDSRSVTGFCDNPKYYKLSAKQLKKIDFVFNSINKKNEIGDIPNKKLADGATMEITENLTYYYIEVSDYSTFSHYKIEKVSGKIFEANHKHYAHETEKDPEFEIIK